MKKVLGVLLVLVLVGGVVAYAAPTGGVTTNVVKDPGGGGR